MRMPMQQAALLGGTFLLTLALLLSGWMLVSGSAAAPTAAPSASPTAPPTASVGSAGRTAAPSPTPSGPTTTRTPWNWFGVTPAPLRTPRPTIDLPRPSAEPGETLTFRVDGRDYIESVVPEGARLSRFGSSVALDTTASAGEPLWVSWRLPAEELPAGAVIVSVDVSICGRGEGDFWEVYGPDGGDPFEYEVLPPGPDGCWAFSEAPGHDLSVIGGVMLRSRMVIDYIEYRITFGR
jgi:hypothetical protein